MVVTVKPSKYQISSSQITMVETSRKRLRPRSTLVTVIFFLLFLTSGKRPLAYISMSLQTQLVMCYIKNPRKQKFCHFCHNIQYFVLIGALYIELLIGSYDYL